MAIEFLNGIKIPAGEINLKGFTIERASGSGATGFDNDALGSYILSPTDGGWGAGTKPAGSHNGVGILSFQTHIGNYYTQLALSTHTNDLFIRSAENSATFGSYSRLWNDSHFSTTDVTNWGTAYTHSQATHAPTDAEANVQADWNETTTTSDAFILNKPSIITTGHTNASFTSIDDVDGNRVDSQQNYQDAPYANHNIVLTLKNDASTGRLAQLFFGDTVAGGMHLRLNQGSENGWHDWHRVLTSNEISTTDITNWDTAYTHSQATHAPTDAEANVQSDWNATSGDAQILNKLNREFKTDYWGDDRFVRVVGVSGAATGDKWVHISNVDIGSAYEKVKIQFTIGSYDDNARGDERINVLYENHSSAQEGHILHWYKGDQIPTLFKAVKSIRSASSGLTNTYDLYVQIDGAWKDSFTVHAEWWKTHTDDNTITYPTTAGGSTPTAGTDDKSLTSRERWIDADKLDGQDGSYYAPAATTLAGYGITDGLTIGTTSTTALAGDTSFAPSAHNHNDIYYTETEIDANHYGKVATDAKFTSTDGSGKEWIFEINDESAITGNKWYKVATVNKGNGGLHIRGFMSNHVEGFAMQKLDLAIGGREGGTSDTIEITGQVDVLHNASGATATDKCGIRIIESDITSSAYYHYFDVYVRTTRYQMLRLHLTKSGATTFHLTAGSNAVTTEPAPVSGGTTGVEIDTSTLEEGNYVVDNSTPREIFHEGHKPTFSEIESTPTTLSGYGITDAAASNHNHDSAYVNVGGDTMTGVLKLNSELQFQRGSTEYSNYIRSAQYVSEGYDNSGTPPNDRYWLEYGAKGGHHFVVNTDGGAGSVENAYDDFTIWNGAVEGDRLFEVTNAGNTSITGNLVVGGNLTVNGTVTTLNTETVEVEDNILQLNTTQGSPNTATAATSGISVFRGLDTNGNDTITQASLIFDEGDDVWDLTNKLKVASNIYSGGNVFQIEGNSPYIRGTGTGQMRIKHTSGETMYIRPDETGAISFFEGANSQSVYFMTQTPTVDDTTSESAQLKFHTRSKQSDGTDVSKYATIKHLTHSIGYNYTTLDFAGSDKSKFNMPIEAAGGLYYTGDTHMGFVPHPIGAQYRSDSSSDTGYILIKLPTAVGNNPDDMVSFYVDVYDYTTNEMISVFIGGYTYTTTASTSSYWYNCTAIINTKLAAKDFNVRFGNDGTNFYVAIGETNSVWSHPSIVVRDVQCSYRSNVEHYIDGWAISTETTALTGVDETQTGNLPQAKNATTLAGLANTHYLDYNNLSNVPTTFSPSAHNHDDRYYTETEIDAQNVTLNETLAALRGWVPGFSNSDYSSLTWDRTEDALRIKSSTDNAIGAVYKAMRVKDGMTIRVTVTVKGDVAGSDGLYLRLQKHDGDLPNGKTHVSHDSGSSSEFVQEDDSEITSWYENATISTDWVTHEKDVTITSDGYISFLVLNWAGNSTNSIWVKNPDIQIVAAADSDKLNGEDGDHYLDYNNFNNVPATFAPSAHNQAWSTITSTPTTIAGYGITDSPNLHEWEWYWVRYAGNVTPTTDTQANWEALYKTSFINETATEQDEGYVNTIDDVGAEGGFGGSTYGNIFGNLSSYHTLITTNIHVTEPFSVSITNFTGDDSHAIFIDGAYVKGVKGCCTDSSYSYTFTQGWHRIDLMYGEGGGGDHIRMGWNPKDYTDNISHMYAHLGVDNPNYTLERLKAIDGAGSGLDSDLLDGQEGTHYLDYNNFSNTPTIPTVPDSYAPTDAEANVQADWNATSGDALILNKPTIPSGNSIIDWTTDQGSTNIHVNNVVGYINSSEPNEPFNPFAGQKFHDGVLTNALAGRHDRFVVTIDGTVEAGASLKLSNQAFEEYNQNRLFGTSAGETKVFNINVQSLASGSPSSSGITYSAGFFDINFYSSPFPASWSARVKNKDGNWTTVTSLNKIGSSKLRGVIPIGNWLTDIEFTLTARTSAPFVTGNITYGISEFELFFSRMSSSQGGNISSIGGYLGGVITTASGTTSTNWNTAYTHSQATHAPTDAEANVQADWNETTTTSDAFILNKPTIPTDHGDHSLAGYLTSSSTQSKYIRSDADDNFTGQLVNNSRNETPAYDKGAISLQPSTSGGSTGITFRSNVNSTSDAGYIWWFDNNDHYNELDSTENGVLLIAAQNDGGATSEDAIAIESSGDIYLNPGVASGAIGSGTFNSARGNIFLGNASSRVRILTTTDGDTYSSSTHNHDSSYVKLTSSQEQEISGDVLFNDTVQFDGDVQNITSSTAVNIETTGGAMLILKDTNGAGVAANPYINFLDSSNTRQGYIGIGSTGNSKLYLEGLGGIQTNNPLSVTGSLTVSTTGNFAGKVNFQGDAAIEGGSGYGVFKGYTTNDNHFISVRGVVANTATTTITGGHQTTFVEHAATVSEGWYFKSKTTGTYREIARIDGTNQMFLGGNKVWNAGNDGSGSGLDADTVDGSHANLSYGAGKQYDFTVNGNADIYYPIVINGASNARMTRITVFRGYSETAPSTWNTASHKGGLTLDMDIRVGGWGGYPNMINVHDFGEIYSRICGGAYWTAHTMKFVIWLRGGGASYHLDSPNTNLSIEVNDNTSAENYVTGSTGNGSWYSYDHSNSGYDVTVSARDLTDADAGAKALLAYMPIRYNGSQNKVISGVSLPTSLDATTVGGINSASFLRSDANDSASGNINFNGAIGLFSSNNTLNGHLYYNAHDAAGNHYPHFKDGSDNGGTTINWRQYYGNNFKTHTWTSDSSGNMVFDFKGQYKGDSLRIDGDSEFIGHVNVGSASDTSNRDLYLHATVANKKSRLRTTDGNLHVDSAEGHGLYLNYYYGAATNIYFGNGNTGYCGTVSSAGILRMASDVVAYYSFSDRRLKTNIKTTENNLDKILSLNPVEYTWKEGPREGVKEIGLIAQEVEEVVPEVVRVQSRHHDEKEEGEEYKQVDYEHLVSTLIGAMQEQQKQIDELKSQISVLNIKNCKCKK